MTDMSNIFINPNGYLNKLFFQPLETVSFYPLAIIISYHQTIAKTSWPRIEITSGETRRN